MQRCRYYVGEDDMELLKWCRGAEVLEKCRSAGAKMQRCSGADLEVLRCLRRGAKVQRWRGGAEVQYWRGAEVPHV